MNEEHFVEVVLVNERQHYRERLAHARAELGVAERLGEPEIAAIFLEDIAYYAAKLESLT